VQVAVQQAPARGQPIGDRRRCSHHPGMLGRHHPTQRQRQQAGVKSASAVEMLAQGLSTLVPGCLQHCVAQLLGRPLPFRNRPGKVQQLC
jgi:hypothetical protein